MHAEQGRVTYEILCVKFLDAAKQQLPTFFFFFCNMFSVTLCYRASFVVSCSCLSSCLHTLTVIFMTSLFGIFQ